MDCLSANNTVHGSSFHNETKVIFLNFFLGQRVLSGAADLKKKQSNEREKELIVQ